MTKFTLCITLQTQKNVFSKNRLKKKSSEAYDKENETVDIIFNCIATSVNIFNIKPNTLNRDNIDIKMTCSISLFAQNCTSNKHMYINKLVIEIGEYPIY